MNERRPDNLPKMEDLEDRRVYRIRCRNLLVGAWSAETKGFIGIREKFGSEYLFQEYHWDADPHVGTVRQAEPLDVMVPDEIPVIDILRARWCTKHDRRVQWRPDEPGRGRWFHIDDDTELRDGDNPQAKSNQALFDLLKPLHDAEVERWRRENL